MKQNKSKSQAAEGVTAVYRIRSGGSRGIDVASGNAGTTDTLKFSSMEEALGHMIRETVAKLNARSKG